MYPGNQIAHELQFFAQKFLLSLYTKEIKRLLGQYLMSTFS